MPKLSLFFLGVWQQALFTQLSCRVLWDLVVWSERRWDHGIGDRCPPTIASPLGQLTGKWWWQQPGHLWTPWSLAMLHCWVYASWSWQVSSLRWPKRIFWQQLQVASPLVERCSPTFATSSIEESSIDGGMERATGQLGPGPFFSSQVMRSLVENCPSPGRKDVELLSQLMWSSTANLGGWHPKTWPSEGPLGWTTSSCRSSLECFYVQGVRMVKSRAYEICKVYGRNEAVACWSKACPNRKREWLWINSLCWMNRAKWSLLRKAAAKIKITLNVGPKRQLGFVRLWDVNFITFSHFSLQTPLVALSIVYLKGTVLGLQDQRECGRCRPAGTPWWSMAAFWMSDVLLYSNDPIEGGIERAWKLLNSKAC